MSEIFTLDNLFHAVASAILVYLLHFLGLWALPVAVGLIFLAREAEQHEAKYPGTRWKPWTWNIHKHAEYLVPAAIAVLTFAFL